MTGDAGRKTRKDRGFTLIEMMVVIVIIGVIAAVAIQQYVSHASKAKVEATKAMIAEISQAIELFKLNHNQFPQDLRDLLKMPSYIDATTWPPRGYLRRFPKDAWNNEFLYRPEGRDGFYDLISLGEDGREGGEGYAKDLYSYEVDEQ